MKAKAVKETDVLDFVRIDKPYISNSYLSTLKRALIGEPQFFGSERYLVFGTEHHNRALEPKEQQVVLERDNDLCSNMADSFRKDPRVKQIMRGAKFEQEYNAVYRGALCKIILDIDGPLGIFDLKGTSCESQVQFLKKAREYDYFRQAALYQAIRKEQRCSFIGQQKTPEPYSIGAEVRYTHPLFWLNVLDFPQYLQEGKEELHYLIDAHLTLKKIKLKLAA